MDSLVENAPVIGLLLFFFMFAGVALWAYRPSKKKDFEEQANIALKE